MDRNAPGDHPDSPGPLGFLRQALRLPAGPCDLLQHHRRRRLRTLGRVAESYVCVLNPAPPITADIGELIATMDRAWS
jgi:hypothetical protein